jgi:hypothetical protein
MRLPDKIENEIRELEMQIDARPGQHAGNARLRSLRHAIENFMRRANVNWEGKHPHPSYVKYEEK